MWVIVFVAVFLGLGAWIGIRKRLAQPSGMLAKVVFVGICGMVVLAIGYFHSWGLWAGTPRSWQPPVPKHPIEYYRIPSR